LIWSCMLWILVLEIITYNHQETKMGWVGKKR
jgi:hypothetical protein